MDQSFLNYNLSKLSFVSEITSLSVTFMLSWNKAIRAPAVGVSFGDLLKDRAAGDRRVTPNAHPPCLAGAPRRGGRADPWDRGTESALS